MIKNETEVDVISLPHHWYDFYDASVVVVGLAQVWPTHEVYIVRRVSGEPFSNGYTCMLMESTCLLEI